MQYPEVVKQNHRYRGPMETRKHNNIVRDISISIAKLKNQFSAIEKKTNSIQQKLYTYHFETLPETRQYFIDDILTVRGGEL